MINRREVLRSGTVAGILSGMSLASGVNLLNLSYGGGSDIMSMKEFDEVVGPDHIAARIHRWNGEYHEPLEFKPGSDGCRNCGKDHWEWSERSKRWKLRKECCIIIPKEYWEKMG